MKSRPLVIAILAKSKAHILPLYLKSLLAQTALSSDTIFYIRTNDNKDGTAEILREFYQKWSWKYRMVFDDSPVDEALLQWANHEWNPHRFKILGEIRQKSIEFAIREGADYFIADADNIILPHTIHQLRSSGLPVVSPLLWNVDPNSMYSNYHSSVDEDGYFRNDDNYQKILYQHIKGLIEVPVVHCTYFIRHENLQYAKYLDETPRHEYVVLSDYFRKAGIPQYIDNRELYGRISFAEDEETMRQCYDQICFRDLDEYITKSLPSNAI
jgi:hypothetical protein